MNIYLCSFFLSCFFTFTQAAEKLLTDPAHKERTFPFAIGAHAWYIPEGRLFVAAQKGEKNNNYALAVADRNNAYFVGVTPEKVTLNGQENQPNPLYGAAISHITLLDTRPIVVKQANASLYAIDYFAYEDELRKDPTGQPKSPINVIESQPLADATGKPASRILALTSNVSGLLEPLENSLARGLILFAAVANKRGTFDGDGSGIAVTFLQSETKNKKVERFFDRINAQTGNHEFIIERREPQEASSKRQVRRKKSAFASHGAASDQPSIFAQGLRRMQSLELRQAGKTAPDKHAKATSDKDSEPEERRLVSKLGNRAVPIDCSMQAIKIGHAVSRIGSAVDMFYDSNLNRLYVALDVTAGPGAEDGARALIVGQFVNDSLLFKPIAPDGAFTQRNHIVGARGAFAHVAIHKVRTMFTSTHLHYLVVVGGTGSQAKRQVLVLPLFDSVLSQAHGTLADVTHEPLATFKMEEPQAFASRVFTQEATKPEHLYTEQSPEAKAGGDIVLPGDITNIVVSDDAIFVSVAEHGNVQAGIFHSQPLFDDTGRINGWTNWRRVAGMANKVTGFAYDPYGAQFWYYGPPVSKDTGKLNQDVYRTVWSTGVSPEPLEEFIATEFPKKAGGVQGLFDFPYSMQGLTDRQNSRISLTAYTGFEKVVLVQSGRDKEGSFGPLPFSKDKVYRSLDGSLGCFISGTRALVLSGGALQQLGPITCAHIAFDGTQGWLLVGGTGGLAVLALDDGKGWQQLADGFQGLSARMNFKKIGTFKNVLKIVSEKNHIFILTPDSLERLVLTDHAVRENQCESTALAQVDKGPFVSTSSFSDVIITGPLALLATSNGLFRSGNDRDIQKSKNMRSAEWTHVVLPESAGSLDKPGPVTRLFSISPTGFEKDIFTGGTVWALNACVGTHEAQVYRLSVNGGEEGVTDYTVQLYRDFFTHETKSFFIDFSDYRNYVITDGAFTASFRSAYGDADSLFEFLPPGTKIGQPFKGRKGWRMKFLHDKERSRSIGQPLRCSASGKWLVPGDFGLRIQG